MSKVHFLIICDIVAGTLSVSADVTFTLEPYFMFTLTCISTGGSATTVTWTRGSVTVTGTQRSHVEDGVTAQCSHTLTLRYNQTLIETRRHEGLYKCCVKNAVSSANSSELRLHGILRIWEPCMCTCTCTMKSLPSSSLSSI